MPNLTLRQIDRKTGLPGFAAALCEVGWLAEATGGVNILKFEEHNGASAKRRCSDAQRKASVRKMSASDADNTRTEGGHKADDSGHCAELEKEKEKSKEILPHTPSGGKASAVSLKTWLEAIKAKGEKPLPEGDPVFTYAEDVGIGRDFLLLAWLEFKHRYGTPDAKRYRDWRSVFRKAVRGNWLKLWYVGDAGYALTTVGIQAQRAHAERAA